MLDMLGRLPEAIAAQKPATELNPLSSSAWENPGVYYAETGDYAAADAALGRAIEIEPTAMFALSDLGQLRLLQSKAPEALELFRKMDFEPFRLMGIAMAEHTLGRANESQQALNELMDKHARESAYQIAEAFAWRGEKDKAFEWLERAYRQEDAGLALLKPDQSLTLIRASRRCCAR